MLRDSHRRRSGGKPLSPIAYAEAMLIVCPSCTTTYDIDDAILGDGRSVRCARCKTVWVATAERTPAIATAERIPAMADGGPTPRMQAPASPADITTAPDDSVDWEKVDIAVDEASEDEPAETEKATALAGEIDAPPLVPKDRDAEAPGEMADRESEPQPAEDIESFAARRMRIAREVRARRRRAFSLPLVIILLAGLCASLLALRERIVGWAPQSAGFYAAIGLPVNLRGLVFEDIRSSEEIHNKVPVLVVEGKIVNVTDRTVEVPRLRFALRNKDGLEIYAWTALSEPRLLAAGERSPFRSQLASPPREAHDIVVRFFNRRDFAAK